MCRRFSVKLTYLIFHEIIQFSVIQILREIKIGQSRISKSANWTHMRALNFDFYEFLHSLKDEITQFGKIQSLSNGKNSLFRISRRSKIDFM